MKYPKGKYIIQDTRNYIGNCIMWWSKSGGYTTSWHEALEFTADELERINLRDTDKPWPSGFALDRSTSTVDMQAVGIGDVEAVIEEMRRKEKESGCV